MVEDWRKVVERDPKIARIDISEYAPELDAVEHSVRRTLEAHGSRRDCHRLGGGDEVVKDAVLVGVTQRPIVPVAATDPARVAVAALQRLRWIHLSDSDADYRKYSADAFYVLQAMVDRLLSRKLKINAQTGKDLLVLVSRPPWIEKPQQADFYVTPVLKQIEQFSPPVPEPIRDALICLLEELSMPFSQKPWMGRNGSKPIVPKRHQNYCARIQKLLQA